MRHKDIDWNLNTTTPDDADAPKSDCARVDLPLLAFETMGYECEICQGRGHVRGIDCQVCGGLGVRRSS